jgi:hypothetical protein
VTDAAAFGDLDPDGIPTLMHAARWGVDFEAIWYRLANDPQFAMEMRYCNDHNLPHGRFLSWAPEDQAKALAHFYYEAQRCQCGLRPDDWPNHEEPTFVSEARFCPGCAELARRERWAREQTGDKDKDALDGQTFYLKRAEDA